VKASGQEVGTPLLLSVQRHWGRAACASATLKGDEPSSVQSRIFFLAARGWTEPFVLLAVLPGSTCTLISAGDGEGGGTIPLQPRLREGSC